MERAPGRARVIQSAHTRRSRPMRPTVLGFILPYYYGIVTAKFKGALQSPVPLPFDAEMITVDILMTA